MAQNNDSGDFDQMLINKLEIHPKETISNYKEKRFLTKTLRKGKTEILFFHSLVKLLDPKAVYYKKTFNKWKELSKLLKSFGYSAKDYSENRCKDIFYKWSAFYAQSYYYYLNNDLEPELQQVFDLLKIVHILDINKMWRFDDSIHILLKKISNEEEIKQYLSQIKEKSFNIENNDQFFNLTKDVKQRDNENSNEMVTTFEDMNLRKTLLKGIKAYGLDKPSEIQKRAIIPCIEGRDVIGQAQSGTGKTAAFVISILQRIDCINKECQALILTPTRELAQQIQKVVLDLSQYMKVESALLIGGSDIRDDKCKLKVGVQIVVGTSGRISDMIERGYLKPQTIKMFVVDEADSMLVGKHREHFDDVFNTLNTKTQLILMSATFTEHILLEIKSFMKNASQILVNNCELTLEGIQQYFVKVEGEDFKFSTFCDLFEAINTSQTFVYCNTREKVDWLIEQLHGCGLSATHIHGDMEQIDRNSILRGFRAGFCRVLLTSDLLGRGIDVQQVQIVVNYDLPVDQQTYIHRVGRGGRFGRKGIAINIITEQQMEEIINIEKFYDTSIEELPENWSQI